MLKANYRLKKSSQFKEVYHKGKSVAGRRVVLYWLNNETEIKVGFSISKKVGNAVIRNRYKRILRACINNFLPSIIPANLVIIARVRIVDAEFDEINKELKYLLKRAKLFKNLAK